jgi:hypothetical protein
MRHIGLKCDVSAGYWLQGGIRQPQNDSSGTHPGRLRRDFMLDGERWRRFDRSRTTSDQQDRRIGEDQKISMQLQPRTNHVDRDNFSFAPLCFTHALPADGKTVPTGKGLTPVGLFPGFRKSPHFPGAACAVGCVLASLPGLKKTLDQTADEARCPHSHVHDIFPCSFSGGNMW